MSTEAISKRPRAICVTSDLTLRKTLRRTLQAGGSTVEFLDELPGLDACNAAIVFIDRACRKATPLPQLMQIVGEKGTLIVLGDSLEDEEVVSILRNTSLNHIITDSDKPDEVELVVTSAKLLSGDIFGLQKYLAWGAKVHEADINTYEEKRVALLTVAQHAKKVGARRHVIGKIESVTDELLMNALYDAPAVRDGTTPQQHGGTPTEVTANCAEEAALMRYACDGRYFAVSVQDNYGELHKEAILDHLSRARAEKGAPKFTNSATSASGAGLGLYFILSSVTRFIANIDYGHRTEVICLFDLHQSGRQASSCARSLHIFTT
jgi:hypothetical protein